MKTFLTIFARLALGLLLLSLLLAGFFALTLRVIPSWGATAEEYARALPGDELAAQPTILWTNAVTIDAPPEQVWPWIAQIGDDRGGFYSYTFIENRVGALTGAAGYNAVYVNAERVHPEWQEPRAGQPIIQGTLKIKAVEPGKYLLADSIQPAPFLWVWLWHLQPLEGGARTRLLVRFSIVVPPAAAGNPLMDFMLKTGGFVMQQNMLQGIQLRAEGGREPGWLEYVEIGLWLAAFFAGVAAGLLYLVKLKWLRPLGVAALAIAVIFVLTFVQPPVWVRLLLDIGLLAGVAWAVRGNPAFWKA